MTDMSTELYDLCTMYDDHIGLSANAGYPFAVDIRNVYHAWKRDGGAINLGRLDALMREYHQRYEAGPMCDCGVGEHVMPGFRVCHPCAEAREMYPDVFEDDPEPDMLSPATPVLPQAGQQQRGETQS